MRRRVLREHDEVAGADRAARRRGTTPRTSTSAAATAPSDVDEAVEARLELRATSTPGSRRSSLRSRDALALVAPRAPNALTTRIADSASAAIDAISPSRLRCWRRGDLDLAPVADRHRAEYRRDAAHRAAPMQRVEQQLTTIIPHERRIAWAIVPRVSENSVADRVRVAVTRVTRSPFWRRSWKRARGAAGGRTSQAQVVRDPLAGALQPQVARVRRDCLEQRDPDDRRGDQDEHPDVVGVERERDRVARDEAVDEELQRPRLREVGDRHQDGRRHRRRRAPPVAADDAADQPGRPLRCPDGCDRRRALWCRWGAAGHEQSLLRRRASVRRGTPLSRAGRDGERLARDRPGLSPGWDPDPGRSARRRGRLSWYGSPHPPGVRSTRCGRLPARWERDPAAGTMSPMNPSLLHITHADAMRAEQTRRSCRHRRR